MILAYAESSEPNLLESSSHDIFLFGLFINLGREGRVNPPSELEFVVVVVRDYCIIKAHKTLEFHRDLF
jgi:hypothetical protein